MKIGLGVEVEVEMAVENRYSRTLLTVAVEF